MAWSERPLLKGLGASAVIEYDGMGKLLTLLRHSLVESVAQGFGGEAVAAGGGVTTVGAVGEL